MDVLVYAFGKLFLHLQYKIGFILPMTRINNLQLELFVFQGFYTSFKRTLFLIILPVGLPLVIGVFIFIFYLSRIIFYLLHVHELQVHYT